MQQPEIKWNLYTCLFQFYFKINRDQFEIVAKVTYGLQPNKYIASILLQYIIACNILRINTGNEAFQVSFKFPKCRWDQRLADFNRFSQ